ncbi:S-adenosyl-L-methionine-dependent methyltransferase [Apiospora hydei]|uniref:S-adenosyl-L-methionine-dependent methyltransferase n=1 Tax=Apiospora hydei TaxID=1337664 RepID=A0ABR1XCV0_9PEZI
MQPTIPAAADADAAASQQQSSSGGSAASHAAAPTSASGNGMQPPITATAATAAAIVPVPPSGQNDSTTATATSKGSSSLTANAAAAPPSTAASLAPSSSAEAASYEATHVHAVYESIAPHFSATRYKPWPVIADFLSSLSPGSVGFDVGCGNGKYLGVNPGVHMLGSDRSASLVRFARDHGGVERSQDVAGRADFAICVAVIHHMSTRERRREAVRALLDCVRRPSSNASGNSDDGGKILVYVWALEQSNSRRGWDEGSEQDLLVPWVMKQKKEKKEKKKTKGKSAEEGAEAVAEEGNAEGGSSDPPPADTTYQRYYHLFRKGELEEDVEAVGGKVVRNGYDKDNWWVVASRCS